MLKSILITFLMIGLLIGCRHDSSNIVVTTTGQIIANEQLAENTDADFIFYNDIVFVFSRTESIETPKDLEEIAKIESDYHFENHIDTVSATKLPPGTKIFKSDTLDILFVEQDEEYLIYEGIPEG
ncbi:hypothetical protein [Alkalihalobacillus pseudalcaliphilus]|uniref:hypothetical protein n=1 Tax=Alkalihalobacillus pseudalcaliphilus TaxID=79884 RepID=UPI00064D78CB|nr:hypothetical protein [Alkalihalobacillus pseudalcaliphilus]KMK76343.1 hypothetical protein AB990_14165 [Alkalihalobacillus pseudalcaliphilus]